MSDLPKSLNKVLSYLKITKEPIDIGKLALDLGITKQRIYTIISELENKGFVEREFEGKTVKIKININGIKYLEENKIQVLSEEYVKEKVEENKYAYKMEEIKNETLLMKKDIEEMRIKFEKELKETEQTKLKIEAIADEIKKFYGRLGEILTLIITAISIIVFNIKVLDSTKIDFSKGGKEAFVNILAIDLPLLILLVVGTFLFHFIIGKKVTECRQLIPVVVLILAMIIIVA